LSATRFPGRAARNSRLASLAWQGLALAVFVALWQALVHFKVYRFGFIPSVPQVIAAASEYLLSTRFLTDAWSSGYRVVGAWMLAALVGIPVGLLIGWKRAVRDLTFPAFELLRPIPPIAWIPAGILFFPSVESGVIFICFVGAFFPILLNTIVGVTQIDQTYFRAAGCLGADGPQVFRDVVVRGAMPAIVIGLAVGLGVCWMAVVAAEMIAGEHGLGYMVWEAYSLAQYPLIIVGMIVIGAIGAGMSAAIRILGHRLIPWQRN
jgi:NitT/TauT family transport system permease protein